MNFAFCIYEISSLSLPSLIFVPKLLCASKFPTATFPAVSAFSVALLANM